MLGKLDTRVYKGQQNEKGKFCQVSRWVSWSSKEITPECIINKFKKAKIVYENNLNEQIDLKSKDEDFEEDIDIDYGALKKDISVNLVFFEGFD